MKRPKKRYFHAQGVQNILSVCRDTVTKPGVHIDWKSIISQYNEDNQHDDISDENDDDSDTGSMDGLGK
jgi:tagatose-1,6-bisphosphate aldolase non-catalytic subunit AgaZ/GatZ